ncbi:MAG: hypothetical protein GTO45_27885 [Candidatus Aminicenantes bacterium]|nr:hypothetical protein [Candidatus Aminicenantes bacterium]NIM82622.1 hypothetical protein [Candidatus Aminicenantes bacterium]NIN21990.1 hypothetical protein [Candidatus Aminicenantes bacterium]NIN45752.1 hypothetical protein [Candidatus Aminicenantes bacterium]NIN88590.1 hypothetical protein [Candidatus Aminicenantes bacterium]
MIRINRVSILSIILLLLNFIACSSNTPEETAVIEIELIGPVANPESEVSGLAWYKNYLVFLPQYPDPEEINPANHPKLFAIPKEEILAYLDNRKNNNHPSPIEPQAIDFIIEKELYEKISSIEGFEGFEAIAFWENKVFMTIEASPGHMLGYLVSGEVEITPALKKITLKHTGSSESELVKIEPKPGINNMAYETLVVTGNEVIALYEANGKHVKTSPRACVYDHDLNFIKALAFPDIEYRITDATALDDSHRFWCINYYYPGEKNKLNPAKDPIAKEYGKGKTHNRSQTVERLVAFEYKSPDKITLVNGPPLQLKLKGPDKNDARNWEGIVRLDNRGFLLVTDKRPWTIFGFVEF